MTLRNDVIDGKPTDYSFESENWSEDDAEGHWALVYPSRDRLDLAELLSYLNDEDELDVVRWWTDAAGWHWCCDCVAAEGALEPGRVSHPLDFDECAGCGCELEGIEEEARDAFYEFELGYLPPAHYAELPGMAGRGKSDADRELIAVCVRSLQMAADWRQRAADRMRELYPAT